VPLTAAQALAKLKRDTAAEDPRWPVSDPDLTAILEETARYRSWAASTAYVLGDRVTPAVWNGRIYSINTPGTSGSTAPSGWAYTTNLGGVYTDGTAVWVDAGPAHAERYDLGAACHAVWSLRAANAAAYIDSEDKDVKRTYTDLYNHAIKQANRHVSAWVK